MLEDPIDVFSPVSRDQVGESYANALESVSGARFALRLAVAARTPVRMRRYLSHRNEREWVVVGESEWLQMELPLRREEVDSNYGHNKGRNRPFG